MFSYLDDAVREAKARIELERSMHPFIASPCMMVIYRPDSKKYINLWDTNSFTNSNSIPWLRHNKGDEIIWVEVP